MKKFICMSIAAITATAMSVPAFADEPEIKAPDTDPVVQGDVMLINGENKLAFEIDRRTIEAQPTKIKDGVVTYKTTDGEGGEVSVSNAVILDSKGSVKDVKDIIAKKKIVLYMSGPAFASNVVPSAVVIDDGEGMFEIDKFTVNTEGALVNEKNTLALNLDENVELSRLSNLQEGIAEDGPAPTAEELDGRWLMVFYENSTKSIPAETTPSKVIVLNEGTVVTEPGPAVTEEQFAKVEAKVTDVKDGKYTTDNEAYAEFELDGAAIFDIDGNKKEASDIKKDDELVIFQNKAKSAVNPEYVVIKDSEKAVSVAADLFVKSTTLGEYVDTQNKLALTIADDTPIVDIEGKAVEDRNLDHKYLMVFYDKVTMSIPGITNPIKVIVLDGTPIEGTETTPVPTEAPADKPAIQIDWTDIINQGKFTYIPVRKYAENLGFKVEWFGETYTVQISNDTISADFKINEDMYYADGADAKTLGAAAMLINDTTYVPVGFFEEILGVNVDILESAE